MESTDINNIEIVGINNIANNNGYVTKILFFSKSIIKNVKINEKEYKLNKIDDELYYLEINYDNKISYMNIVLGNFKKKVKIKYPKPSIFKSCFNQFDLIGIQFFGLVGIKNTAFIIQGTKAKKEYEVKILADDKEVEYTENYIPDDYSFSINAKMEKNIKNIKVNLKLTDDIEFNILSVKNNIYMRIKNRVKEVINKIFNKIRTFFIILGRAIKILWREHHFLVPPSMWKKYIKRFIYRMHNLNELFYDPFTKDEYNKWLSENKCDIEIEKFKYNPLISFIIPVYNVKSKYLSECLDSILNQTYDNFEVCIVDDCSTKEETLSCLKEYEEKDKRIRVTHHKENGHISKTSNDAIKMAKGEYIALVDNDDTIDENALYYNVKLLNENKNVDMVYSDEDKLDLHGRFCDPNFKPDFSPDTLMSLNYICHFTMIRKEIVNKVGGFEVGLEGAQDHDLFLKISEITKNIYHIPKILYHWRMSETSTAMKLDNKEYINDIGIKVIENALKRRKLKGTVTRDPLSQYFIVNYEAVDNPLVSIIIPTKDYADITEKCLESLFEKTAYKNYEVILMNNNSEKKETFELFDKYKNMYKNFKVIDANYEFNYSKINNEAVKKSKGEYVVLLNNDTEIIDPKWLEIMLGYAQLDHIGAVGPKLLYPDMTVQHAGVILGLGGVASHAYLGKERNETGMYGRLRVPYDYGCVTAACLMVKKSKYNEVGGLEESLKVAYNDVDFNLKLLQKGYNNICVPQTELIHYESKSRGLDNTSEKYKRFLQESDYMYNKWDYELKHDKYYNPNFTLKYWFVLDRKDKKDIKYE